MNEHHYNRNLYLVMRTALIALVLCLLAIGGIAIFYSAKGVIYNPVFRLPAWIINNVLGKTIIPSSTTEFTRLYSIPDYYTFGDTIIGVLYLFVATVMTFYFICFFIAYIYTWINHYCLVYKLGAEGVRTYEKEQQKKLQRQTEKSLSALESAQHEHWVQWKRFYKSELDYEEWKEKIINK
ncbi:TPA: hypothetical protein ACIIU7_005234 [Klebsiella pneumoniae]|nr:hypothetical protein [Klebsiella pneumoniae]HEB8740459.1 hypothetical protein [Klebsiella pneumoniae]